MIYAERFPHVGIYFPSARLGFPEQRWETDPVPNRKYLAEHKLTNRTYDGYVLNYCMVPR